MNTDLLLAWLQSENSIDRIRAARRFAKESHPDCATQLRIAYQKEDIPWVKTAIHAALAKNEKTGPQVTVPPLRHDDLQVEDIQSQAINESIGQVLHELEPAIGRLRVVAREATEDFEDSQLYCEFEKLDELIETFEKWRAVEQKPQPKNCSVKDLLRDVMSDVVLAADHEYDVHLVEAGELAITTDPQLLRIIISNALRNAVESSQLVKQRRPVTLSYGKTDTGIWISVVDLGIGLSKARQNFTKAHISTKPGHKGMGLAIVDRGVRALRGVWDLRNGSIGGAEFFLELPETTE